MRFALVFVLLLGACGVRSPLDPFPDDPGVPGRDASVARDADTPRRDGGPPPGPCSAAAPVRIARGESLRLPEAALGAGRILVIYTATGPDGRDALHRALLRPDGDVVGRAEPFGNGEGGTLAFFEEFGAYLLFANDSGELVNATLGLAGELLEPFERTGVMTTTRQPALAITSFIFGLAWDQGLSTVGVFGVVDGPEPEPAFLSGREPHAMIDRDLPEWVRLSTIQADAVLLHRVFAPSPTELTTDEERVGGEVVGARVILDGDEGFAAVSAERESTILTWRVGGERGQRVAAEHDLPSGLDTARDTDGTTLIAWSASSRLGRAVLNAEILGLGAPATLELAAFDTAGSPRPAAVWTGEPGRFLVISVLDDESGLVAFSITCR